MRLGARRGLIALGVSVAALLALAIGWKPPGPRADPDARAGIKRFTYRAGDGVTISALRAGTLGARRVVLVHGTPGSAEGWADYLLNPLPNFEIIAVDRPGFGQSEPSGAVPLLARQAEALRPLLDREGEDAAILVGHSLGGPIVAEAAAAFPGRVAALVLLAASLDPGQERIHPLQRVGNWPGVSAMLPRAMRNANRELLPLERELEKLSPRLAGIRAPVTIVHGTADRLVPYANVPFMQRRLTAAPSVRLVRLKDQDHFLPWTHRAVVERAIRDAIP